MVEFTVEEILVAERALGTIAQAKLPVSVGYQISKLIKVVGDEIRTIRESQMKIAEKYGERDEQGMLVERDGVYPISKENQEAFNKEMEELLEVKCNLQITPINIEKLGDKIELSVSDLLALGKFLTEPTE